MTPLCALLGNHAQFIQFSREIAKTASEFDGLQIRYSGVRISPRPFALNPAQNAGYIGDNRPNPALFNKPQNPAKSLDIPPQPLGAALGAASRVSSPPGCRRPRRRQPLSESLTHERGGSRVHVGRLVISSSPICRSKPAADPSDRALYPRALGFETTQPPAPPLRPPEAALSECAGGFNNPRGER